MTSTVQFPPVDPIEYLCQRRYPLAYEEQSSDASSAEITLYREADEKAEAYRKELEALPHNEMMALFEAECEKERENKEYQDKLRREEKALFFHQPEAQADLSYWSKMAFWSLDEAIALSFGKNPGQVNWSNVSMEGERFVQEAWCISKFPREYARRRELVGRAKSAGLLSERVKPEHFVRWAVDVFDNMPAELLARFAASPKANAAESLASYPPELRAAIEAYQAVKSDPSALSGRSPREALERWLEENKPEIGFNARKRIVTVANWSPQGGAPKTPGGEPTLGG